MPQESIDSVISNIYNIISKNLKTSCKALGMDKQTNKMSLSTNVRPPRFVPSLVTKVNVGCGKRCVFPDLYPVSNRDFRHPSVLPTTVPAVWLECSGQSVKWEGSWQKLQACRSRRARQDADKQDQPMRASCFHNGSRFQLLPNHHKPGKVPFHGSSTISAWQGSSSQFPIAVPLRPAHCCVWTSWPLLWVSLQGQKSGGNSTLAHGRAAFLEGKKKRPEIEKFSIFLIMFFRKRWKIVWQSKCKSFALAAQ